MHVMGIVFTNDVSLGDLTDKRTMASLPFGGRYRQVDFALSNLSAAGVRHVGIIARHSFQSLMNHIGDGEEWGLELEEGGLEFLTPYSMSTSHTYRGKLESLYSAMDFLRIGGDDEYLVMIDAAVLSNIDLTQVLESHVNSHKDVTVVTKAGVANGSKVLDLALKLDEQGQVADMVVDFAAPEGYLASMDLFVVSKKWMVERVKEHMAHNRFHMDRDLVLGGWQRGEVTVNVFPFPGVAMFNESVQEYFHNSLALTREDIRHSLFHNSHPVYTKVRSRVPTYYGDSCQIDNCIVADGCRLYGGAENSVLFRQVTLCQGAQVNHCVIMNDSVVGEGALLENVILDKDVVVRPGTKIIGTRNNPIIIKRGEIV